MTTDPKNPFENSALTTILVVSDMEKSKKFYLDILGAKLEREYGGDSVVLEFLESWLLLVTSGGPTEDKPNISYSTPDHQHMVDHSFTIRVENCQHAYQLLVERGAKFLTPPVTNGQETRCFFRDPDGHLFEISEYRS